MNRHIYKLVCPQCSRYFEMHPKCEAADTHRKFHNDPDLVFIEADEE